MTTAITLFFALTVTLATSIVLYALSLRVLARGEDRFPWPAIVPFASPFYLWRRGERGLPIALCAAMLAYTLLWISASMVA